MNKDRLNARRLSTEELTQKIVTHVKDNDEFRQILNKHNLKTDSAIEQLVIHGLKGTEKEVFSEIKKKIRSKDGILSSQIKNHEVGFSHEVKAERLDAKLDRLTYKKEKHIKNTPNKNRKYRPHFETVERKDKETGETVLQEKKKYTEVTKLRMGERNVRQILLYQSFHQPSKFINKDFREAELQDGNEGVQMVHGLGSKLHHHGIKPFVRKNTPFGFDYHQSQSLKFNKKISKVNAKSEFNKKFGNGKEVIELKGNTLQKQIQKRRIKRDIYRKHGLSGTLGDRLKSGVKSLGTSLNPINYLKTKASQVWGVIASFLGAFQFLLSGGAFLLVILIPVIAIVNIFSIFFGFNNTDPNIEIANMTEVFQEAIVDVHKEMYDAESKNRYTNASRPFDEIRVEGNNALSGLDGAKRQLQAISYVSAYYQDELTFNKGRDRLKRAVEDNFLIKERYQNEP